MARTATPTTSERLEWASAGLKRFVAVPFERQTYLNLAYLLLAFPLGLAYFVFVTVGVSLGLGLAIIVVGIPILAITLGLALGLAGFERWLTTAMLPVDIESRTELAGERGRDQLASLLTDVKTWTVLVYLPAKFVVGTVAFTVSVTGLSTGVSMLMLPFYYDQPGLYVGLVSDRAPEIHQTLYLGWNYLLVGFEAAFTLGYWEITTLPQALVGTVAGAILLLLTFHTLNALARITGWFARMMLENGYDPMATIARSLAEGR
ncbi:sensor domain-containing protein [Natrialbaceae archaeon A-arb3/5]